MGNNTQKKPITKQAVYERLSKQLDDMDKAHNNKPLKLIKRAIIKAFNLKRILRRTKSTPASTIHC